MGDFQRLSHNYLSLRKNEKILWNRLKMGVAKILRASTSSVLTLRLTSLNVTAIGSYRLSLVSIDAIYL